MRIVAQRVSASTVSVDGDVVGSISAGLNLLIGFGKDDSEQILKVAAEKIIHLRIFPDAEGRFQHSLLETKGELLLIPNFTLYGDTSKGRRPDFFSAMEPERASQMFTKFVDVFRNLGVAQVAHGVFGAHMQVEILNDGPVTMILDF